jgi:hypothetical protein
MAAVSTKYCDAPSVLDLLPKGRSLGDLSNTDIDDAIHEASREVDGRLASIFIPFNDISATIKPPRIIRSITARLASALCLDILFMVERNGRIEQMIEGRRKWATDKLESIVERNDIIPHETATQALTPGTGGEYDVEQYEAFITNPLSYTSSGDVFTVLPETVRVVTPVAYVGYQYGVHYDVRFSPRFQKWVFNDRSQNVVGGASPSITYAWTYQRHAAFQQPGSSLSGHFAF